MITFLSDKLANVVERLHHEKLTPKKMENILHEVKIAFLDSDVNYAITTDFIKSVGDQLAKKDVVLKHKKYKNEFVLKVMKKRMIEILDNQNYKLKHKKKPSFFMFVGLQGSGKTTTVAKIAHYFQKNHKYKILVVACDIYRPAATIQLQKLCKSINVTVVKGDEGKKMNAVQIAKKGIAIAIKEKYDMALFDTAGRTIHDRKMIIEITKLKNIISPVETIFVVDAMIGQGISPTAKFFTETLNITAAILTKFDSETRSGSAFTLSYQAKIPIIFVGVGERINDLDKYYPERIVKQILGMGDLDTLVEKTEANFSLKAAEGAFKQFMTGSLSLDVVIRQMESFTKIGPLKSITRMIPGMPKLPQGSEKKFERQLKIMKAVSGSATPAERASPELLREMTRKIRILKGSGVKSDEYNKFLKLFSSFNNQSAEIRKLIDNQK